LGKGGALVRSLSICHMRDETGPEELKSIIRRAVMPNGLKAMSPKNGEKQ
jgi:hypothetical protein